jgi:nucleoside-diphosphate-sugar epimerase
MVIVVTGGTGFIGAAVVMQILANGYKPVVLIRKDSNLERLKNLHGITYLVYDSLEEDALTEQMNAWQPDSFIHLAWKGVSGAERNEAYQITENIFTTLQSVKLAGKTGCKQWIGIGSQAEYGNLNCKISEVFATLPTTLYGKAKLSACWAAMGLCESLNIRSSWIRVFSTYGVGDQPNWFIPYIAGELLKGNSPLLTKCEQLWDYLYVDDAAAAILSVVKKNVTGIYNIGSGKTISLKYIVDLIRNEINPAIKIQYGAVPYRPDQVMHLEADIAKIQSATAWKAEISIEEGIKRIVKDLKKNET